MFRRKEQLFAQIMLLSDLTALLTAYFTAYWLRNYLSSHEFAALPAINEDLWLLWIIVPTWVLVLRWLGLYQSRTYESPATVARTVIEAQLAGGLILLSGMFLAKRYDVSRLLLQLFLLVSGMALLGGKLGARAILIRRARWLRSKRRWRVLIVGHQIHAESYFRLLKDHPYWAIEVIALIPPTRRYIKSRRVSANGALASAQEEGWAEILSRYVVDEVVAVSPWDETIGLVGLADACTARGLIFRILVQMPPTAVGTYHVEDLEEGRYLVSLETVPQEFIPLAIKRLIDIAGAAVGLIMCALIYPWYAWRLRKESAGPVLFKQPRGGQNGRLFDIYKFRTMYLDAEELRNALIVHSDVKGVMFKMKDDPRVTPTGRLMRKIHLDEFPQFWNVLKGDMSLVGARPNPATEVAQYSYHHYRRLSMKPGLTGLFQLNGHGAVSDFEDTVKLDCEYIDNWSLWLDFKIIAKTVVKVFSGTGW